jgi:flagellar hook-associated protein 3 FlgL
MTYRVSTLQLAQTGLNGILKNQSNMNDIMSQISTGKRNDLDPIEKVQQLSYSVKISNNAQNIRNGETIMPRLNSQEQILGGITDRLMKLHETMISVSNPSSYDKEATQVYLDAIKSDVLDLVNTRDESGNYLFSGYSINVKPFSVLSSYSGDQGIRKIQISEGVTVDENVTGNQVITKNVLDAFDKLQNFITTGINDPSMIDSVQKAMSDVSLQREKVGLNLNKIDSFTNLNEDLNLANKARLSQIEDADMLNLATKLSSAQIAAEASLKSYASIQKLSLFNYI